MKTPKGLNPLYGFCLIDSLHAYLIYLGLKSSLLKLVDKHQYSLQ